MFLRLLKRAIAWLQLNHDTYLFGLLGVTYLASHILSQPYYLHLLLMAQLSLVCGLVLFSKVTIRASIRVASTHKLWALALVINISSLFLAFRWENFVNYLLAWSIISVLIACLRDRQLRYTMAKVRIKKRQRQQARWRKGKQAVLAEWKARLRWLAGVQHDVRQPLNALGLLLNNPALSKGSITPIALERLLSCHRWLKELAENTLEATRLELRESREIQVNVIGSVELCNSLQDWLSHLAQAKGLDFQVEVEDQTIQTDVARLKRVLGNLLFNAVEHSFEGTVELKYRRRGGIHQFVLKTTGRGFPRP